MKVYKKLFTKANKQDYFKMKPSLKLSCLKHVMKCNILSSQNFRCCLCAHLQNVKMPFNENMFHCDPILNANSQIHLNDLYFELTQSDVYGYIVTS